MKNLLRLLTVWMLLLALPFQGMAAAAMLVGAPLPAMPPSAHAMPQMDHAQLPPCHRAATPDSGDRQHQAPDGGAPKCASCAACGIFSAMLPASFPGLASHAPPGATCAAAEQRLPSVHLAQPERPPRPRLA